MEEGYIKSAINQNIATIEFYHPAHNSMPGHLLKDLKESIENVSQDTDVTLIILKSNGDKSFCAGASFTELAAIKNFEESKKFFMGFANVINAIRKSKKLVIGRIQGKAVGGGVGLAAACDYTFATTKASVRLSELAVGIGPFVIGPVVERKIGLSAFSQMALTPADWQSAVWAHQRGLYFSLYDSIDQLDEALNTFVEKLSLYNREALEELKKIFWEQSLHWDQLLEERAAISGRLLLSDFSKNAISDFLKNT